FGSGMMTVSDDGQLLFLSTPSGIRVLSSTPGPNMAVGLTVTGPTGPLTAGVPATYTVTAQKLDGGTAPGYSGTIHFSSDDPQAGLPADATLTNGAGTFTVILRTAGDRKVTVTDPFNLFSAVSDPVTVVHAAATFLRITPLAQ